MLSSPVSTRRLCAAFLVLLLASGCTVLTEGDDSMTVRVTALDVNTREPLPTARVGIGYDQFGVSVNWIETTNVDARGQAVFEVAECGHGTLIVNAFSAQSPSGRLYGPRKEYIACEPGETSVILEMAQY